MKVAPEYPGVLVLLQQLKGNLELTKGFKITGPRSVQRSHKRQRKTELTNEKQSKPG